MSGWSRPPVSRDKPAGPARQPDRRQEATPQNRVSTVSRREPGGTIALAYSRTQEVGLAAAKTQEHIARLKTRRAYYAARIRDSEPVGAAAADRASAWERPLHGRQPAAQIQWLITELDRLFFELLGLRENQLVRHTVWSNRFDTAASISRTFQ